MIDLLKNYRELNHASGYMGSIRYYLAKKKLDTLFIKWLSTNKDLVETLYKKAQNKTLNASDQPNPLFSHHRVPLQNFMNNSMRLENPITPPRNLMQSTIGVMKPPSQQSQQAKHLTQSTFIRKSVTNQVDLGKIPQFFFKEGKPLDNVTEASYKSQINTIFGDKFEITAQNAKSLIVDLIGLPNYFSVCLMNKVNNQNKITKVDFNKIWRQLENKDIRKRAFLLMTSDKAKKVLVMDDFKKLFKQILNKHPGLQFLKETPQFQDWYSLCVINRMFFMANRKGDYRMTYREFKKSNILKSLCDIQAEPDINKNRDFFSYEDFYVIYIKFWQLDHDHDFKLTKEKLAKYSGYTLSRKTVERIFLQVAKKFQESDRMTFGDFVWFILCVEDKTSQQSLDYWFKILDLDNNGIVAGYQLEYFYQQQNQRLAYMDGSIDFHFENLVCQMIDLLKPQKQLQFTLDDFLKKKNQSGTFINMLTDLNKLIAYEQRDAYEQRNIKVENPTWTEWDNFVKPEYKRIESQADNDDGGQVLNWENDQ